MNRDSLGLIHFLGSDQDNSNDLVDEPVPHSYELYAPGFSEYNVLIYSKRHQLFSNN